MEYIGESPLENVGDIPRMGANRYGEKDALVSGSGLGNRSYKELDERSDRVAEVLRENGVGPGDRVGLYLPNTLEFPESYFGVLKAGGVVVPLNLMLDDGSLRYIIEDAGIEHVVSTPLLAAGVERDRVSVSPPDELLADGPVEKLYVSGGGDVSGVGVVDYEDAVSDASGDIEGTDRSGDDLAVQMYTSGTTGDPKGVLLTHRNILTALESFTKTAPRLDPDDTLLLVLPLFHIYGLNVLLSTHLYSGAVVVLQATPEPNAVLNTLDEHDINTFPAVPAILRTVYKEYTSNPNEYDIDSLETVGSGAAPLPEEVKENITEGWGVVMGEGWAMTETAAAGAVLRQGTDMWKPSGCVGKPMHKVELRLVDPDTGETVVPHRQTDATTPPPDDEYVGAEGEIAVRGPQVFEGYHGLPEKTDEVFDNEGWFYTGDVAEIDEDGDLWMRGRTDDMIHVGGENVYPEQVENVLNDHPSVVEAGAAGVPHEVKGEAPVAFVVLEDEGVSEEELRRYALDRLPSYAHPRRVFFVEDVPRSATQKVQRFRLRERAEEIIGGELEPSERL
jgi:long-chain acyl-CoA synthetase